jgi:hypothetical protein
VHFTHCCYPKLVCGRKLVKNFCLKFIVYGAWHSGFLPTRLELALTLCQAQKRSFYSVLCPLTCSLFLCSIFHDCSCACGLDDQDSVSRTDRDFSPCAMSRQHLEPTQSSVYQGIFSQGMKQLKHESQHLLPSKAAIKNAWSFTSHPYITSWYAAYAHAQL